MKGKNFFILHDLNVFALKLMIAFTFVVRYWVFTFYFLAFLSFCYKFRKISCLFTYGFINTNKLSFVTFFTNAGMVAQINAILELLQNKMQY